MKKKKLIEVIINNKKIKCFQDQTVLEVAQENEIDIPSLCYHSDLKIKANCRLCLVKLKDDKSLYTSCSLKVKQGMEVITESAEINKARKINL